MSLLDQALPALRAHEQPLRRRRRAASSRVSRPPRGARAAARHRRGQGVGFRPFVYNLARALGITGWVINTAEGVFVPSRAMRPPSRVRGDVARARPRWPSSSRSVTSTPNPKASRLQDPRLRGERRRDDPRLPRHRHVPARASPRCATARPPAPLPVHQLHQLRAALHHRRVIPTTAPPRRCATSRCAPRAAPSTATRRTAGSTRSPTPATCAGRASS